eukprot:g35907.t1
MKKVFSTRAFTAQTFGYKSWNVILRLYRMLVRLLSEFQLWLPCYRKDIAKLERVQKRFIKRLPGMEGLNYRERLDRLGPLSLECRRLRGDLIEAYKIMRGMDKVNGR